MRLTLFIFILVLFSIPASLQAAHIVGGDMTYECLANDSFRVTLKVYRDCDSGNPNAADYDAPASIAIYDINKTLIREVLINYTDRLSIPVVSPNPCISPPSNICVEEATYEFDYKLPPLAGGYDIVYTRCCRNGTISNIANPGAAGSTYTVHIDPAAGSCNNSPTFNDFPPVLICANEPLVFDHSATDIDGNTLTYEFCIPLIGGSQNDPKPEPPDAPPFNTVNWITPPFTTTAPLTASPAMNIDANTGLLTGTPTTAGQYVVGICVKEYDSAGNLIGEIRRDFQFNVTACNFNLGADIPIVDTVPNAGPFVKGIYVYECSDYTVDFVNTSKFASRYLWDFGDPTSTTDNSTEFQPAYTYPDTGSYTVTLIANPGVNCADTIQVIVRIFPTFSVDFDFQNVCEGETASFNDLTTSTYGTTDSWLWTFGNGTTSNTPNTSNPFPDDGNYSVRLVATNTKGCKDTVQKIITVYSKPDVAIRYAPPCINSQVFVRSFSQSSIGQITNQDWYLNGAFDNSNGSFRISSTTTSTVNLKLVVTTEFGCTDSLDEDITFLPLPTIAAGTDTTICESQPASLTASGGVTYSWSPPDDVSQPNTANTEASPAVSTNYYVTVTDSNRCTNIDSVAVTVNPLPEVAAGADTFVCVGGSMLFNGTTDAPTFNWSPGTLLNDSTILNPFFTPDSSETFTLYATSQFGCQDSSSIFVEVQYPITASLDTPPELCFGDSLEILVSGGRYYEWLNGNVLGPIDTNPQLVAPESTTNYTVIASNDCPSFSDTLDITVVVNPLPTVDAGPNDSIYRDEITVIPATSNGTEFVWSPPNGLNFNDVLRPEASPFNTTRYVLTVTDFNGCVNKDSTEIFVEVINLLLVPNAFSPNADGHNDVFRIVRALNVEKLLDFKIFNRWGQVVFETQDLRGYWDGTFKGEPVDLGVFAFFVRVLNRDGDIITETGNVTLVR